MSKKNKNHKKIYIYDHYGDKYDSGCIIYSNRTVFDKVTNKWLDVEIDDYDNEYIVIHRGNDVYYFLLDKLYDRYFHYDEYKKMYE